MFQFSGFPPYDYVFITRCMESVHAGFPIRKSAGHRICAPYRSLSQLVTSFFGSQCQGIHPALFLLNRSDSPFSVRVSGFSWFSLLSSKATFHVTSFDVFLSNASFSLNESFLIGIRFLWCLRFLSKPTSFEGVAPSYSLKLYFKEVMPGSHLLFHSLAP